MLGCVLSGRVGDGFRRKGLKRLPAALKRTVLADGGHASRSPQAALDLLYDLLMLEDAPAQRSLPVPPAAAQALEDLSRFVRAMSHRLISVLSAVVVASGSLVAAAPSPTPVAPAKDEPAGGADAGGGSGSAVDMPEDAPPADMNGTDENPDAPHDISKPTVTAVAPTPKRPSGYPTEEALRPITLPQNMSEVSISPHANVSPYFGSDALRARYGITSRIQLGLTYVLGGIYKDPATTSMKHCATSITLRRSKPSAMAPATRANNMIGRVVDACTSAT